jgi:catechol 2,3-dioxygenase-like lactoylglutathione lyase family enzyme
MGVEISKIRQVKVPVTNLAGSVRWYMALLDLELGVEFFEQGAVRGVVLLDRDGGYVIALRDREFCASRPHHEGFDLFALGVASPQDLHQLIERCQRLGFQHGSIEDRGPAGLALDIPDPDGTVLRFLWDQTPLEQSEQFVGLESRADGSMTPYKIPRLAL